ncbi:PD-(D/E)XK nuclease family transposase [Desertivirga brevis]|uniref:PD-(D/E)XK nuclease family transposase n=1 Tax=Desertivirga brevis TaxID=2810310 RepID=UPI001A95F6C9
MRVAHFIKSKDLSNFVKEESELLGNRDKWMYMLKHMSKLDKIPAILNQRIFKKIFQISEVSKLTKEERMEYESSLKARWDYENAIAYTEQVAREEERAIAEAKLTEERAKAEADKEEAVKKERTIALAAIRQLKKTGMSNAEIAKEIGISESEVE